ncbi:MAG: OB-fold domain-containing protein [Actinomycetota bacterium]
MQQVPIAEGLFTWPAEEPRLLGARCTKTGTIVFPSDASAPGCAPEDMETVELSSRGTLWSWTIQGFPPKSPPYAKVETPATFEPYGVGYVELPGELRVETRLTTADPDELEIGMPMELRIVPFMDDEAGNTVMTFAFAPAEEG